MYVPDKGDNMGLLTIPGAVKDFEPDVIYCTADPGSVTTLAHTIPQGVPVFGYVPVEGEPMLDMHWRRVLSSIDFATCSRYGHEVVKSSIGREVPWVYHGVDQNVFRVNGRRDEIRQRLGWDDKFVVICVAQNVRRKQWPRLIEAIHHLKFKYKQDDVVLYAHTVPFQNYWLEGWHLPTIAQAYGVSDIVQFNQRMDRGFGSAVNEVGDEEEIGLVDLYNAADLFVLPSQVEGFGLPIAEAMACGVPVMVTKYAAGWEVAAGGMGVGIPVKDWEIAKNGTKYANVDPLLLAKEIHSLRRSPKRLEQMREAGLRRVQDFNWEDFEEVLIRGCETASAKNSNLAEAAA